MDIISRLKPRIIVALKELYGENFADPDLTLTLTKPEFDGDYTLVLFSFVKRLKRSPEQLGKEVGELLVKNNPDLIKDFNVIKGFLNLNIPDSFWISFLEENYSNERFGFREPLNKRVIVEYSSPNTNKPIHLGHLRNNFLGWSVAEILKRSGYDVVKTCISNDRGIHICKSMIAWQLYSNGATPDSTGIKGDHFVGNYYVLFNEEYKKQVDALVSGGMNKDQAEKEAPLMRAAQQMLVDWEAGKPEVITLWKKMNGWVYEGFEVTYKRIGSDFTKNYYESETYIPGKRFVEEGLAEGVFFKKPDGGVWIDLTPEGLDEKLVLRKDGTSVYITQDLGLSATEI